MVDSKQNANNPTEEWWGMVEGLRVIAQANDGNPNVKRRHPTHGRWLNNQRKAYKEGTLPAACVQALEELGVVWDPRQAIWDAKYEELKVITEANGGNPNVQRDDPTHGLWLTIQRKAYKNGTLLADRARRLEALGVVWEPLEDHWKTMVKELKRIAKANGGDPNVDQRHPTHGMWLHNVRMARKRGELPKNRERELERLGVVWTPPRGRRPKPSG